MPKTAACFIRFFVLTFSLIFVGTAHNARAAAPAYESAPNAGQHKRAVDRPQARFSKLEIGTPRADDPETDLIVPPPALTAPAFFVPVPHAMDQAAPAPAVHPARPALAGSYGPRAPPAFSA